MHRRPHLLRIATSALLVALLAPTASAQFALFGWKFSEFQPNVPNGGRASTISVNPLNNNHILVASESGGLFRSTDRGVTWKHVDALPEFGTSAVAFVPADTNIVIATVGEDTRVANGGGIWRSTNGGASWTQLPGPPTPAGVTTRLSAFEISIAPDNGTIYVGTQYGVSISQDRGATWTHVDPFGFNRRVVSVLGQSGNHVLAGGASGIRRSTDGGNNWSPPTTTPGGVVDMHALGGSPFSNNQAYVVNSATQLWFTEDAGDNWTRIMSAPAGGGGCGGISFVKTTGRTIFALPPAKLTREVTLYAGNRCYVNRLIAPQIAGTNNFNYGGTWTFLNLDHMDTRDLAFTTGKVRAPLLLATDGGLHKTVNGGLNWTFTGGGVNGYNALQITEVKGQWISSLSRYDLYYGTQDNDLRASGDMGASWINPFCCEGFFIEMLHRVATPADSRITFVSCGPCGNFVSGPLFTNVAWWPNATTPAAGNPKVVRKNVYVQGVDSTATFAKGLAGTTNLGVAWAQYATFTESRRDLPKLSDPGFIPVLYQSIRTGWNSTLQIEINHLARIPRHFKGTTGFVTYPLMNNFGGLGINPTMFAWYQVFGVDPGNTLHLIAPDVINEKMMETYDGGNNWTEIPNLTSQVTNAGQFLFRRSIFPQASAVSFSPDDPNVVAVGTWQAGVFISADRGATWTKVPGSERATYITSIAWRTANDAVVSTYGRGLWAISWGLLIKLPDFERWCRLPCKIFPIPPIIDLIDPIDPVPYKHAVLVFNGRIQGAVVSNGILRELFVSPGSSMVFFSDTRREMNVTVTESKRPVGFRGVRSPKSATGGILVGLTLGERGNPLGGAFAENTLSMYEPSEREKNQDQEQSGRQTSPTADRPYLVLRFPNGSAANTAAPGTIIEVSGRNFPRGLPLEIAVDDSTVQRVVVGERGDFRANVRAPSEFGLHSVTVRDAATRRVIDGAMFIVKPQDTRRDERAPR